MVKKHELSQHISFLELDVRKVKTIGQLAMTAETKVIIARIVGLNMGH